MTPVTISAMPNLLRDHAAYLRETRMLRPRTIQNYARVLDEFTGFLENEHGLGLFTLEEVDSDEIERFLRHATTNGDREPSRSGWNNRLSALRSFYNFIFKKGLIVVSPAQRVDRIRTLRRERVPLSFDEMVRLVDAAKASPQGLGTRNAAIVLVFLHNSFRVSELVSLDVVQADLDARAFLDVRTKGGHSLSLGFNDLVAEALEKYATDRGTANPPPTEKALFLSKRGTRISVRAVQEMIRRCVERAGIKRNVSPHLLRHTSGTTLAELGVDIHTIQAQLGHASIITTERYVHLGAGHQKAAVEALDRTWRENEARIRAQAQ